MSLFIISDQAFGQEPPDAATAEASASAATRIEVDKEAGLIRFFVEGEEAAHLDANGLHVRGDMNYGGSLTDYGHAGFNDHIGRKEYERLKAEGHDAP